MVENIKCLFQKAPMNSSITAAMKEQPALKYLQVALNKLNWKSTLSMRFSKKRFFA